MVSSLPVEVPKTISDLKKVSVGIIFLTSALLLLVGFLHVSFFSTYFTRLTPPPNRH